MAKQVTVSVTIESAYIDHERVEKEFDYRSGCERSLGLVSDDISEWICDCLMIHDCEPEDVEEALENVYLNGIATIDHLGETEIKFRLVG